MNSFEITIYGMADDSEMLKVQDALIAAGIGDGGDEEIGAYLQHNKERSVYIAIPTQMNEAVEVINALGYETDEDEALEQEYLQRKQRYQSVAPEDYEDED